MKLIINENVYRKILLNEDDDKSMIQKIMQLYMSGSVTNFMLAKQLDQSLGFNVAKQVILELRPLFKGIKIDTTEKVYQAIDYFFDIGNKEIKADNVNLKSFPMIITKMPWKEKIQLQNNDIAVIPEEITNIRGLKDLDIHANLLTGLPQSFGSLENLTNLDISDNNFSFFPEEITKLQKLKHLDLSYNPIENISDSIGDLANTLQTLYLHQTPVVHSEEAQNKITQLLPNTHINFI